MAYVDNNNLIDPDKMNQGQGSQMGQSGMQTGGSSDSGIVTGGGGASGGTGASAGATGASGGTGGSNGWTNIQSYINANAGDTGSSQFLNDKVGSQFNKEQGQLDSQASQAQSQGDSQAQSEKDYSTKAASKLSDLGNNYSYGQDLTGQNDAYKQGVSGFQSAYNGAYTAPKNFSYGMGADTSNAGANLQNDSGFGQMMGNIYNQKSGGQLSSGSQTLQNQLDVNNSSLNDTRQNLLSQYANLGSYANKKVTDTNNALAQDSKTYGDSQGALKDYVNNQGNTLAGSVQNQEANAKTDFANTYNGKSGLENSAYLDSIRDDAGWFLTHSHDGLPLMNAQVNSGNASQNASWASLQNEIGVQNGQPAYTSEEGQHYRDQSGTNLAALNKFYADQNNQYANTADPQKRQWNSIQDILNSGAAAKAQGFQVAPGSAGTIIGGGKGGATKR